MSQAINEKLGAWMLEHSESRTSVSQKLNISRPTFNKRINGDSKWKWHEVIAISELIGVPIDELA